LDGRLGHDGGDAHQIGSMTGDRTGKVIRLVCRRQRLLIKPVGIEGSVDYDVGHHARRARYRGLSRLPREGWHGAGGSAMDVDPAEWRRHQRYLLAVAYRLQGSLTDAEDAVQEAYLRLADAKVTEVGDMRAWLSTVVSRICLDQLRSARARRESYVGPWLPEPLVGDALAPESPEPDPAERVTLAESVHMAMLIVLESLSPAERTAFVLHDVFGLSFAEIGRVVGRTPGACRQLASRARHAVRPLLFAIAYRILGSVAEAEDAVQETWLRYESFPTPPASTKAFLSAVVTRVSIDVLRSARVRRETYVGQWFPEPLLADPYEDPARSAELADSLSMAALLLLERLSPLERAVFVLREVFGFGFPEVAVAVGRSEAACRQLAVRARRHMDVGRPRFEADRREREELAARFFDAVRDGDVDGLRELLAADVQMVGDGGGKAPAFARSVIGADNVARVLASISPVLARIDARVEPREVNGQPGAILRDRDGKVVSTLTLDVLGGRIQTIRSVVNPDKLGHLGPVADAWAIAREVKQARRLRD
jgi:RNA polymerase sigma-70 factor (ECF subfamily)